MVILEGDLSQLRQINVELELPILWEGEVFNTVARELTDSCHTLTVMYENHHGECV